MEFGDSTLAEKVKSDWQEARQAAERAKQKQGIYDILSNLVLEEANQEQSLEVRRTVKKVFDLSPPSDAMEQGIESVGLMVEAEVINSLHAGQPTEYRILGDRKEVYLSLVFVGSEPGLTSTVPLARISARNEHGVEFDHKPAAGSAHHPMDEASEDLVFSVVSEAFSETLVG